MERAKLLFGCYRRGDANDPEVYVAACTSVLAHYPTDVVRAVTDPFSGLPAQKNERGYSGLPDVADVKEACEKAFGRPLSAAMLWAQDWERKAQEQIAERETLAIEHQKKRKTYDELCDDCAAVGIYIGKHAKRDRALKPQEVAAFREKYGISQADWDAIPTKEQHAEAMRKFSSGDLYPGPQAPTPKEGGSDPNDVDTLDQPL